MVMEMFYLDLMKFKPSLHIKDVISLFSGTLIFAGCSVLSNIVLARNLDKNDFGSFNAINSTVALLTLIVLFGLNITSVRVISKFKKNNPNYIKATIERIKFFYKISITVICLIYLVLVPFISEFFFKDQIAILPFYFSIVYLFSFTYTELVTSFLTGLGNFVQIRNLNYLKSLLSLAIMLFSFVNNDFITIYIFFVISNLIISYMINKVLNKIILNNFNEANQNLPDRYNKKIITYSSYIFLGGVVVLPFTYISNIVISSEVGIQVFAILSVFTTWQGVLTFFPVTYSKVVLPFISGNRSVQSRINKFAVATRINNFSVYFIYLFLILFSSSILDLYGENYRIFLNLFNLYLGSTALAFIGNTYGSQVQVKGYRYTIVFGNLMVGMPILLFTILFHNQLGLLSLCLGMLFGNCLGFLVSFFTIWKKDSFPYEIHLNQALTFIVILLLVLINFYLDTYLIFSTIISLIMLIFIDNKFIKRFV